LFIIRRKVRSALFPLAGQTTPLQNCPAGIRHSTLLSERLETLVGQGFQNSLEAHIFTELVGIQLLLMNTLGPIARGEQMAADQVEAVFRQVQTRKAAKGHEILNKRRGRQPEAPGT
jgi:hypothetical protein